MRAWRRIRVFGAVVGVVGLSGVVAALLRRDEAEERGGGEEQR